VGTRMFLTATCHPSVTNNIMLMCPADLLPFLLLHTCAVVCDI
jgi:hypothetical protein